MSSGLTINLQGSFTSNGSAKVLSFPSGLDSLWVYNKTILKAGGGGAGATAMAYWDTTDQIVNGGLQYTRSGGAISSSAFAAGAGFTLIDTSLSPIQGLPLVNATITGAVTPPVVTTGAATTSYLANGMVVRLYNQLGAQQLSSMDFTVDSVVTDTSFTLAYMQSVVAGTGGTWSIVNWDSPFYPRRRYITKILATGGAVGGGGVVPAGVTRITTSVTHSYTVGQQVRFVIPVASSGSLGFGMYQLDGLTGNIVATGKNDADSVTNTFDVDIDSSGFSPFVFPLTADYAITFAEVVPVGENTALSLASPVAQTPLDFYGNQIPGTQSGILADATVDTTIKGIVLSGGANGPAGVTTNFITWSAMVAYSVNPNS